MGLLKPSSKVYVAGHTGLVGAALVKRLKATGCSNLILRTHEQLDLMDQAAVRAFFEKERPEFVFFAAGKVGGVYANNTYRAEFLYENVLMQSNVIHNAYEFAARKLMFFGCSCIYPRDAKQPMRESAILAGPLEPTNEPFALAKITGLKMVESYNLQYGTDFISVIPTNLYGPNQNNDPLNSIVIPSLMRRFHEAKLEDRTEAGVWGSGNPTRDFLYSDDLADAAVFLMDRYAGNTPVNIGTGVEISVRELAEEIKKIVGFKGELIYDDSRPDGVARKLQDLSLLKSLGWSAKTALSAGLRETYRDFAANYLE